MLTNGLVELLRCSLSYYCPMAQNRYPPLLRLTALYLSVMCHVYGLSEAEIKHKRNNEPSAKQPQCYWCKVWSGYRSRPPLAPNTIPIENYKPKRLDSLRMCNILRPLSLYRKIGIDSCSELSTMKPVAALYFKGLRKEHEETANNLCMQTKHPRSFPRSLTGAMKYIGSVVR